MTAYIDEQSLLTSTISGFRKGHTTTSVLLRIRDDLIQAMKRGEVRMMVMADYSKAFDTVEFKRIIMKMADMGFSKNFILWIFNYLSDRWQFVQIDDKTSEQALVQFGVPQGSILGPVLFNLYVTDLHESLQCPCYQYADDTTFYQHTKVPRLDYCASKMNDIISELGRYSIESNLALNESKTKWMLFSSQQMSRVHQLHDVSTNLVCNNQVLERVSTAKLLGVQIDEHLSWKDHITSLLSSCYSSLSVLKKLRNLAPLHVRKLLMETLILSKLDYCSAVFHPLPQHQVKRLQRIQNVCAGYVNGRYASERDCLDLGWLPIKERRDYCLLNLTFKALYFEHWPEYLRLQKYIPARTLRSSNEIKLQVPLEKGTFQESAAQIFNALPSDIRNIDDFNLFNLKVKTHLKTVAAHRLD